MSYDMKSLTADGTMTLTAQIWGKDDPTAATPSNFPVTSLLSLVNANAGTASLQTVASNFSFPPVSSTNNRIMTVVVTATATVTLPTPAENVILNVKAAPGVTGVQVTGHMDNVSSSTAAVPAGYSVQLHGSATTWWII